VCHLDPAQPGKLCAVLPGPPDDLAEHVNGHVLADLHLLGLVVRVLRHVHNAGVVNRPTACLDDKLLDLVDAPEAEPALQHARLDFTEGLSHQRRDAHPDSLLETADVGRQVRVDVVAGQRLPELGVLCALQLGVEHAQLADRLGEVGRGRVRARGGVRGKQEMQRQVELGRRELRHGLDQDVCDDLIFDAVGVELVAVGDVSRRSIETQC